MFRNVPQNITQQETILFAYLALINAYRVLFHHLVPLAKIFSIHPLFVLILFLVAQQINISHLPLNALLAIQHAILVSRLHPHLVYLVQMDFYSEVSA